MKHTEQAPPTRMAGENAAVAELECLTSEEDEQQVEGAAPSGPDQRRRRRASRREAKSRSPNLPVPLPAAAGNRVVVEEAGDQGPCK